MEVAAQDCNVMFKQNVHCTLYHCTIHTEHPKCNRLLNFQFDILLATAEPNIFNVVHTTYSSNAITLQMADA